MHLEQGSVTHDNAKDVVEIVGNAACERAKALEFLGLHKLLLKPLSIGHIPDRRKHSLDIPFLFQWSGVGLPVTYIPSFLRTRISKTSCVVPSTTNWKSRRVL